MPASRVDSPWNTATLAECTPTISNLPNRTALMHGGRQSTTPPQRSAAAVRPRPAACGRPSVSAGIHGSREKSHVPRFVNNTTNKLHFVRRPETSIFYGYSNNKGFLSQILLAFD